MYLCKYLNNIFDINLLDKGKHHCIVDLRFTASDSTAILSSNIFTCLVELKAVKLEVGH